ncbi:MAG: hypothetical protein RLZZ488_156 [Pseudomonadota bacterium]|jgi:dihydrofolate synthase/folylpolyglutamate synthase
MTSEKPDFTSFDSTVAALFSRVRGHIEPGAHRIQKLLGNEILQTLDRIPTILVAGTNGKGSTCALLEKCLRDAGLRTGLYTSPHLVCPTERIRLNGVPVSREYFLQQARVCFDRAQVVLNDATFFELITSLGFAIFAEKIPDVLICEVGLGGRLDSTNVLSPQVSVLTSVGLDHTEWLGDNEESIAFEKSQISRRNRPFVVGRVGAAAKSGVKRGLAVTGAHPVFLSDQAEYENSASTPAAIICSEVLNQLRQLGVFDVCPSQVERSLRTLHWPGRFDVRKAGSTPILLDGAHNSHGVEYFLAEIQQRLDLRQLPRPHTLVYASLQDKDWQDCLKMLIPQADHIFLTQTQSARAVPAETLLNYAKSINIGAQFFVSGTSCEAFEHALSLTSQHNGTLMILGSLTLIGEALEHFKFPVFKEFEVGAQC